MSALARVGGGASGSAGVSGFIEARIQTLGELDADPLQLHGGFRVAGPQFRLTQGVSLVGEHILGGPGLGTRPARLQGGNNPNKRNERMETRSFAGTSDHPPASSTLTSCTPAGSTQTPNPCGPSRLVHPNSRRVRATSIPGDPGRGWPARRLRANLGVAPACNLLAGELTAGSPAASRGWPERLRLRHGTVAPAGLAAMLADCAFQHEYLLTSPLLAHGRWEALTGPDGAFTAAPGERWLYLVVGSPVTRRNLATNLGVPNPEALTFCELEGTGAAELWINGQPAGGSALPGTLSDLWLEQGWNHLLLRWTGGGERIALRFRTIMRRAETEPSFT